MALRNKAFGSALEFVWAVDSSEYAVRESATSVKVFKNFKEKKQFKPELGAEGTFVLCNFYLEIGQLTHILLPYVQEFLAEQCLVSAQPTV